jgi:hypothetical protein
VQTVPNSDYATPPLNATGEANSFLVCGTRVQDHNPEGNCDICEVCLEGVCATRLGITRFEGSTYHTRCLISSLQRAVTEATAHLQAIESEFARACAAAVVGIAGRR